MPSPTAWDADLYDRSFSFVSTLGRWIIEVLAPQPGERILDLGCGTGRLTAAVAETGAVVHGIDADAAMIAKARADHPTVRFDVADGHAFELDEPVDGVMSNAALHWMLRPDEVIARVHAALRPGGRFVAEFGGQGNVATIHGALIDAAASLGLAPDQLEDPWYFPSPAEHATRLEAAGFRVRSLELVDRPTLLTAGSDTGSEGLARWIRMFCGPVLAAVPDGRREEAIRLATAACRPALERDGRWYADYVRLRFSAERAD